MNITTQSLKKLKESGEKFSCVTAYDATFARLACEAGIDVILVGDSLGMVLQGQSSTLPVSMSDMVYHTQCVSRGTTTAMIMADMPFNSINDLSQALDNASKLMQAGAHIVKLEGDEWLAPYIQAMSNRGIPVCAHLGLTPQSVNKLGGYRVQGKQEDQAQNMVVAAKSLVEAGADIILLECVPSSLAEAITNSVDVPVIGIGAGSVTDGQVLVMHDLLGITIGHRPKFVKNFMEGARSIEEAFKAYNDAVKSTRFPGPEHSFS
ncbi:MAG: 3-methyl-2-oxobutanoate hydroxymethyltransferase [Phototrophicales bacterium]|nr:MAG: 3-methyl-2-oxobutanoate hydroxymethyltransferase [Phototrophicales bacterium]